MDICYHNAMINKIKNRIEQELKSYLNDLREEYPLRTISPVLYQNIREFFLRKGKRARPLLFVLSYLGYSRSPAHGLYRTALSLELLHDFMLVHDDIIDKSDTRRGKPSMHAMLNSHIAPFKDIKFTGEDLTIVIGDVMYALALHSFLAIKENLQRKENALKKLIKAALYTGSGEFIELLCGAKKIERMTLKDAYKVYDLKTANYTFASPLAIGSTLAGAPEKQTRLLFEYGIYLGRAFQIKDDIIGMFSDDKTTGKSALADLREAKKTMLVIKAYQDSGSREKSIIKKILACDNAGTRELMIMRRIIRESGSLDFAAGTISSLCKEADEIYGRLSMKRTYKENLRSYVNSLLNV